ncbi:hypothetical protein C8J56DRAFT_893638 [Mycena floridula]|nr:hypothetical protein C8J56DRAFT_893638 [Mycena floridula]
MPAAADTKGKSKVIEPVGGSLLTDHNLEELENLVPVTGPLCRSACQPGAQPLAPFNPTEYTEFSPGGQRHVGVLYRFLPGQAVQPSSGLVSSLPPVHTASDIPLIPGAQPRSPEPTSSSPTRPPPRGEKGKSVGETKPKKKLTFALPVDSDFASNSAIPADSLAPKAVPHAVASSTKVTPSVLPSSKAPPATEPVVPTRKARPAKSSSSNAAVPVASTSSKAAKASKFKPAVPPPAKPAKSTRPAKPVVVSANPLLPPAKISSRPAPSSSVPSNVNLPSATVTKPKPAIFTSDTKDSFNEEQFEPRLEDLQDLSGGSVGDDVEEGSREDLGGQGGVERVRDEDQPEGMPSRTDLKSYIAQKRTRSAARSSPEPEKVSKRSKRVEAPAAPDVSMDVEAIFRTVFGHPLGSNDQGSSKPVPKHSAQLDMSNAVQSTVLFLPKDGTVAPEAQEDWDARIKITMLDGRTMAVDRNTYDAFRELIASAAEDLASGSGNQNQEDPNQSLGDSEQEQLAPPAPENHLLNNRRKHSREEEDDRGHSQLRRRKEVQILQGDTIGLGPGHGLQQGIPSPEVANLTDDGKAMLGVHTQVVVIPDLAPLPQQRTVTEMVDTGLAIVGLLAGAIPDRRETISMTRGPETGALLPRIDTDIEVPGHHLADGARTLALALVPEPEIADIPVRVLSVPDRVQGVLGAGWLSPIGLGALTTKAVRAAKEKAFSKPGGFQLDKETGLVIQSVRTVDNSGDKDLTVLDFLEASTLFVRAVRSYYVPQGCRRTGSSEA